MGNFLSRQNAAAEEDDYIGNHAYKYPPRMGNFFGTHFIMGGERFDTPQPESYLFGENADLNFLGNRPTAFPYPPPQANEPTKTLKSLINIRKESVRFVRVPSDKKLSCDTINDKNINKNDSFSKTDQAEQKHCNLPDDSCDAETVPPSCYNIEFIFDSDAKCGITVYYFCTEDVSPSGVTLTPREGLTLTSDTYHYERGINQFFSQPSQVFNPKLIPEDDLVYNAGREQYPVAIHCVIEEGNDESRQSHTTICVIDHHPESNSYVLRALKQKIFVDGLCYLLQEIYGIENKAVNKSSLDEDIDDHGSECVICMSETRDTLILPCRHLCLCNSCADSLRYQANNCPICRAPFRALLQIRAVQKGVSSHLLHQNTPNSVTGESASIDVPPGYIPVSLIEALNGPPQYVARVRCSEQDITSVTIADSTMTSGEIKSTSPLKASNQRRSKIKKNASTSTTTHEVGTSTNSTNFPSTMSVVEIENCSKQSSATCTLIKTSPSHTLSSSPEKQQMYIVNERQVETKYQNPNESVHDDEDSENENLSPLLSPSSINRQKLSAKKLISSFNTDDLDSEIAGICATVIDNDECSNIYNSNSLPCSSLKRSKTECELSDDKDLIVEPGSLSANLTPGKSDYFTPGDTQNSILLSPLCSTERTKSGDPLFNCCGVENHENNDMNNPGAVTTIFPNIEKKKINLSKKSTSVGNIVGPSAGTTACGGSVDLKSNNISSLPDMLDSPISLNSASTRSSSDSYSSSSSTKQLLSSNLSTAAANIIVDDKTALQNAVNV